MKKKSSREGICQLCGCQGKLCMAHIMPKALKYLLGPRRSTFLALRLESRLEKSCASGVTEAYPTQNLEFDRDILCSKCDNEILGKYDKILVIFYNKCIQFSKNSIILDGYDIEIDKRLYFSFLTILYRHSISKKIKCVIMPEKYKNILKYSLINEDFDKISKNIKIYILGYPIHKYSNSISQLFGGRNKNEEQYFYILNAFGLDVFFIMGNIHKTILSNELNSMVVSGKLALLQPDQENIKIPLADSQSFMTEIMSYIIDSRPKIIEDLLEKRGLHFG